VKHQSLASGPGPIALQETGNGVRLAILWAVLGLTVTGGGKFLLSRYVGALEAADQQAIEVNRNQDKVDTGLQAQISAIRELEASRDAANQAHRVDVIRRLDRIEAAVERNR